MILLNKFINYQFNCQLDHWLNYRLGTIDYEFYKYRLTINNKKVLIFNTDMVSIEPLLDKKDNNRFIARHKHWTCDTPYLDIKIHDFILEIYYDVIFYNFNNNRYSLRIELYLPSTWREIGIPQIIKEYRRVLSLG